ncbi:unnamed protein product [Candida verbasci]|uniref:SAGA complex subunit Spt7 n=1 Tax=Candida verbasci TaxID=1227364 RepID=A0A9W4TTV8_9ASCO|nr:unnamed protein product [Candida verbasci]
MNQLAIFQFNDSRKLFKLAKLLNNQKFFENFLNDNQFNIINHILSLDNYEIWNQFLEGNCFIKYKNDKIEKPVLENIGSEGEETENKVESNENDGFEISKKLALHIRYLLWEKAIDFYYSKEIDPELKYAFEDDVPEKIEKPKVRELEDDYDDEDEEEEEKGEQQDNNLSFNSKNQLVLTIPLKEEKESEQDLNTEFNKVYHNFEYDRETLIKRRKLEQSNLQLDTQPKESTSSINLGVASTSLQHLLMTIQQKRDEIPLNDSELKTLFLDVRKNRGKWANDDRMGQEELYEACEKVVSDLRNYTEHSTFFLNKVSKREAPNYGLIIKKPMDLNTVMKKLKNLAYNSKNEFVDDLMLIWSNCLTYNADPKHFIRAHALAMQKKCLKLIPTIPDIKIKNRSDVQEEEEEEHVEGKSVKGRKTRHELKTEPEKKIATPINVEIIEETPGAISEEEVDEELKYEEDEEDNNWRYITSKSRANYCEQRASLFVHNNLNYNAHAITRKPSEMKNFSHYLNQEVVKKTDHLLEEDPYLIEYDISGGIPGLYNGISNEDLDKIENDLVESMLKTQNQEHNFIKGNNGLNKLYLENISEIQEIRKICFKISLIRQMQTQQFVHHTQMKQPEIPSLKEIDSPLIPEIQESCDEEINFAVIRKATSKIAMMTGFEKTESDAINCLANIAEQYLGNIAKTIKIKTENTSPNQLSNRNILLSTLLESGVTKPDDLYTFIKEKIIQIQVKLKTLRENLSNFLKDLLRPSLANFDEKNFDDNSEQFVTGDFSYDLQEDFFGFKELGLDKEFNMLSTSIPILLLHQRNQQQQFTKNKRNKFQDLENYKVLEMKQNDPNVIGILKPFYNKMIERSSNYYKKKNITSWEYLVEDELLPQKMRNIRPKISPTGKIGNIKKKIVANAFLLDEPNEIKQEIVNV